MKSWLVLIFQITTNADSQFFILRVYVLMFFILCYVYVYLKFKIK